jgi:hypothetical protein
MSYAEDPRVPFVRTLMPVWLVVAVWDAVCATALHVFAYDGAAAKLWQGVAYTVLGPRALTGGATTVAAGLALHLAVALVWSALFVGAVRASAGLRRAIRNPGGAFMVAVAYGPAIWLVMSLVVIPMATGQPPRFGPRWWVQLGIHVPFVALPLVFTARRVLQTR